MGNILHLEQFKLREAAVFDLNRFHSRDLKLDVSPSFALGPRDHIFVMGSCFAAEVCRALNGMGFAAKDAGQGLKYNVFSMLQALGWALADDFDEQLLAPLKDGRFFDGHRHPFVAYATPEAGVLEHRAVLRLVSEAVRKADVIVLTLGLVEVWHDSIANVWLNQTPPVNLIEQTDRFRVHATTHAQNLHAFQTLLLRLHEVNPACRMVCSVSPVPLKATFCGDDVLVANCYSKSTLRSVVSETLLNLRRTHGLSIDYFPAYELATLRPREEVWSETIRDNEPDGRHVRRSFVDDVIMRLFLDRYLASANMPAPNNSMLQN
jgi:hypothetical protein